MEVGEGNPVAVVGHELEAALPHGRGQLAVVKSERLDLGLQLLYSSR
jgi:hypothetical protein